MNNFSFGSNYAAYEEAMRAMAAQNLKNMPSSSQPTNSWRNNNESWTDNATQGLAGGDILSEGYPVRENWSPKSNRMRSRSRSRSRERYRKRRSRSRSRDRNRSKDYDNRRHSPSRPRQRYRSPRRRNSPDPSSCKVVLNNLPTDVTRDTINVVLAKQNFHPLDIRVIRKVTDNNAVRVFAFVEFSSPSQAAGWIKFNEGVLLLEGCSVLMEFSREYDGDKRSNSAINSSDWTCAKCTINNFNRRTACFKCGTFREDSDALQAKGYALVGIQPCDTLLIRELPTSVTEESIRAALAQYSGVIIQRVHIASSKRYALVQLKSKEDSSYLLSTFNKIVPYVDNCAVIVTFSRQSLNQVLIADNVNNMKSQSGITSVNIHEDPTNSAALLAQNAIQMIQMSRQNSIMLPSNNIPVAESVSTPFGYLKSYSTPNLTTFQLEPVSGYYYDNLTGFYYDINTEYYFNSKSNQWMFWCSKYSTYIPCEGGNQDLKKSLQEEEKNLQKIQRSSVISEPPSLTVNQAAVSSNVSKPVANVEGVKHSSSQKGGENLKKTRDNSLEDDFDDGRNSKKDEDSKSKSALDIQREMNKWAKRQEKVKMTFKSTTADNTVLESSSNFKKTNDSKIQSNVKTPFDDAFDDEDENPIVPDAVLPSRMRNVGLPLNYGHAASVSFNCTSNSNQLNFNEPSSSGREDFAGSSRTPLAHFDEEVYVDRAKLTCLLCRRQFPNVETLNKHIQLSDLHKTNLATKLKEFQQCQQSDLPLYRDRAKERRQLHGFDATGLAGGEPDFSDPNIAEELASFKAKVPLDNTNIGNRMLKSMGWSEGQGLGRNAQGIVNPLTADQRVQGVGLGASGSKLAYGTSRRERLKQAAIQRFNDLTD